MSSKETVFAQRELPVARIARKSRGRSKYEGLMCIENHEYVLLVNVHISDEYQDPSYSGRELVQFVIRGCPLMLQATRASYRTLKARFSWSMAVSVWRM